MYSMKRFVVSPVVIIDKKVYSSLGPRLLALPLGACMYNYIHILKIIYTTV